MHKQKEIAFPVNQFGYFPGTRFMGSKNKIIHEIWDILYNYNFNSFLDAFAGSNVVGYFMKTKGKNVMTNDFMKISYLISKAIIENSSIIVENDDINFLLHNPNDADFVSKTFKGLYFTNEENQFIDKIRFNISLFSNEAKRAIALSSLVRACMKKRPRGIFTYIGPRYNDGRKDLKKSLKEHFTENIHAFNKAVFDNNTSCKAYNCSTQDLNEKADLVYIDPPYFTPNSDNDYVRRYHFVEGLAKNWDGLTIQNHTKTKKFESYKSPFSRKKDAYSAFNQLIKKYVNSLIVISYSSNSLPTKEEMIAMLKKYKDEVQVHELTHVYSFGNQNHKIGNKSNRVKEYLFVGS